MRQATQATPQENTTKFEEDSVIVEEPQVEQQPKFEAAEKMEDNLDNEGFSHRLE